MSNLQDFDAFQEGEVLVARATAPAWTPLFERWIRLHILGMGTSYIVLLTAFYVDNSPRLPLWDRLPVLAF